MAKKGRGKGNKPVSKRGHVEDNVIRYRLEQTLRRIDRKGKPIPTPINNFGAGWLSEHLNNSEVTAPPVDHSKILPPNNVASFADAKKNKAAVEAKKTEFDTPPSIVHNPFIKEQEVKFAPVSQGSKPLDPKFYMPPKVTGDAGLAPSGVPIRVFTEGKYKPKEKAVVYTTPEALPPTPTRDWRAGAVNDNRYDNAAQDWVAKTKATVQWFINHVEPQNWSTYVHNLVNWSKDGASVNNKAVESLVQSPEIELLLTRELYGGLKEDWLMLDKALEYSEEEIMLLKLERSILRKDIEMLEYELAAHTGEMRTAEEIRKVSNIGKTKTPDDADELLLMFNTYKSFVRSEGEAAAFARYALGDPKLGKTIAEHADARLAERVAQYEYRNMVRFLQDFASYQLMLQRNAYQAWWEDVLNSNKIAQYWMRYARRNDTAVVDVDREAKALARISARAKKVSDSIYYSSLVPQYVINDKKAGAILSVVRPHRHNVSPKKVASYIKWWEKNEDAARIKYNEITRPVMSGVVRGYNKLVDVLNTEVNPFERKRKKDWVKNKQLEHDEIREQHLERKAKVKEKKALRNAIRTAQRLAY